MAYRTTLTSRLACITCLLLELSAAESAEPLRLLESPNCIRRDQGCTPSLHDGTVVIDTHGAGAVTEWSTPEIQGPVELHFRLKTSVVGDDDQYIVYWTDGDGSPWQEFRRIPFHADGQWHEHRLPLADRGTVAGVRFAFSGPPHRVEIADIRLHSPPCELPSAQAESAAKLPAAVEIGSAALTCRLDCRQHAFTIRDRRTGRAWRSEPAAAWLQLTAAHRMDARRMQLQAFDHFAGRPAAITIALVGDAAIRFSIEPADPSARLEGASNYPPRFSTDMAEGSFVFCDRSCGVVLDQRDPAYAAWPLRVYGNTHCLDMPWIGLYDRGRGDGMMLLVETPADAEVALVGHSDGRHWPEIRWRSSLDSFRYERIVTLRFTAHGGYVRLAKDYRELLQQSGRFRTLREKAAAKPLVERLRGAPSLWGGRAAEDFLTRMLPLGINRGVVGNCKDPATIARLNGLGFLTGRYDSYTDILEGSVGFQTDDVAKAAVRSRPGGPPKLGWKLRDSGQQMYWRTSALWEAARRSYVDEDVKSHPYTSRFVDVAGAAELLEDYHPEHTFDRRQDLAYRRQLFTALNRYGLVLGTEHGNDWVVDQVEYLEGTMSGPFWWSSWDAGYLVPPQREQLSPEYVKFGMGYAHRVPLWELVYHDCAVTTWYWGDTAGMLHQPAPELADRKDLFNILYGTPPLIWTNNTDYQLPRDLRRMLRTYHDTCPLHQVVAFEEMIDHEFVSEDRAVQCARFADGTVIAVNFSDEPREFPAPGGRVMLAPRGYWAVGPQISQTRLWIDGAARTVIAKDGYLTVDNASDEYVAGVRCPGRATAFRVSAAQWNLFIEENRTCAVDIPAVTGWTPSTSLCVRAMDERGRLGMIVARADERGIATFTSSTADWRFALQRTADEERSAAATAPSAPADVN